MGKNDACNEESKIEDDSLAGGLKKLSLEVTEQKEKVLKNAQDLSKLTERQNKFALSTQMSLEMILPDLKETKDLALESLKQVKKLEYNNKSRFGIIEGNFNKLMNNQKTQLEDKIKVTAQNKKKRIKKIKTSLNNLKKSSETESKSASIENLKSLKNEMAGIMTEFKTEMRAEFTKSKNVVENLNAEVSRLKNGAKGLKDEIVKRWGDLFAKYNEMNKKLQETSSRKSIKDLIACLTKRLDQIESKSLFL